MIATSRARAALALAITLLAPSAARAQAAPKLERFTVTVDGHPFAVWARRPAHPKGAIVLLHGRTWSALPDFDLQVPGDKRSVMTSLAAKGYATYALDLRGYGATPRDSTGWDTPGRSAEDLAGVVAWVAARHRALPAPTLVGWSNGSMVSQLMVQRHPALVSRLVLFGYPGDPDRKIPGSARPAAPTRAKTTAEAAASDFISPDVTPKRVIDAYVAQALKADPVRTDWTALDEWNELDPAKVTVPTLLMHGERDPIAPMAAQARTFTKLGTADKEWLVLAGGDHAALVEDTHAAFVSAIVHFIERPRAPKH